MNLFSEPHSGQDANGRRRRYKCQRYMNDTTRSVYFKIEHYFKIF